MMNKTSLSSVRDAYLQTGKRYFTAVSVILLMLLFVSCQEKKEKQKAESKFENNEVNFAKGFKMNSYGSLTQLTIFNPWIKDKILQDIYFYPDSLLLPDSLATRNVVRTPVQRLLALSATQWGPLLQMGEGDRIKGVSEAKYVSNAEMKTLVAERKVVEVAADGRFEVELMLLINPDLVMYSPDPTGVPTSLKSTSLPLLAWPDYFETDPLGRAEWIKILGVLVQREATTERIYNQIVTEYQYLQSLVKTTVERPTVFADKAFAGQWYLPGGKSYMARLFEDAGATYLFTDNNSEASFPLDIETIFSRASHADFWRVAQAAQGTYSYSDLQSENELYASFHAFKNKKVIYCNTYKTAYFEKGPLEPHHILADFIAVFHPELLPNHKPYFHQMLQP